MMNFVPLLFVSQTDKVPFNVSLSVLQPLNLDLDLSLLF